MTITITGINIHVILNELGAISADRFENMRRSDREVIDELVLKRDEMAENQAKLIDDRERLQDIVSDYDIKLLDLRKVNAKLMLENTDMQGRPQHEPNELRTARADIASLRKTLDATDVQLRELQDKYEDILDNLKIARNSNANLTNHLRAANDRADKLTAEIAALRATGQLDNSPAKD